MMRWILVRGLPAMVALLFPAALAARAQAPQPVPQMEDFWHIFIAYAIAWVLLFGWLLSILKRLRRVEEKLDA
jgi:CcmD family protein